MLLLNKYFVNFSRVECFHPIPHAFFTLVAVLLHFFSDVHVGVYILNLVISQTACSFKNLQQFDLILNLINHKLKLLVESIDSQNVTQSRHFSIGDKFSHIVHHGSKLVVVKTQCKILFATLLATVAGCLKVILQMTLVEVVVLKLRIEETNTLSGKE